MLGFEAQPNLRSTVARPDAVHKINEIAFPLRPLCLCCGNLSDLNATRSDKRHGNNREFDTGITVEEQGPFFTENWSAPRAVFRAESFADGRLVLRPEVKEGLYYCLRDQ